MSNDAPAITLQTVREVFLSPRQASPVHQATGRMGGLATLERHGTEHMREIAKLGGRPTREEAARKYWQPARRGQTKLRRNRVPTLCPRNAT